MIYRVKIIYNIHVCVQWFINYDKGKDIYFLLYSSNLHVNLIADLNRFAFAMLVSNGDYRVKFNVIPPLAVMDKPIYSMQSGKWLSSLAAPTAKCLNIRHAWLVENAINLFQIRI